MAILLLYTGGTIGMAHDPVTNTLSPIDFRNITKHLPVLNNFKFDIEPISFNPLQDSSNFSPETWVKIADTIEESYDKFDGFVVLHGTDTMAYTASALSFMLENLAKPVILTGSQLPVGLVRTDGRENIISSLEIASSRENDRPMIQEVCICFSNKLTRGNRTTKFSTEQFSAYKSPNYPALVDIGLHLKFNHASIHHSTDGKRLKINRNFNTNVAILKLFPGISRNAVHAVLTTPGVRGIILETFGAGNAPTTRWFLDELKGYIEDGGIVFNVTQCGGGIVEMGVYETSREMISLGVVSGHDITFEASVTKLMFLLANCDSRSEVIRRLTEPISGEMSR